MEVIRLKTVQTVTRNFLALPLLLVLASCNKSGKGHDGPTAAPSSSTTLGSNGTEKPSAASIPRPLTLFELLPACEIDHEGPVVDFGQPDATDGSRYTLDPSDASERDKLVAHGGSSFQQVTERRFVHEFWLDESTTTLRIRARVIGRNANAFSASIDGRRLGRNKLTKGEVSVVSFPRTTEPLTAGPHTLLLEAHGRVLNPKDPFYDLDWLNFNLEEEATGNDSPPTLRDIIADQELDSVPRRSIVLRASSHLRCPLHLSSSTRLDVALGFWGTGTGTAEIAIVEQGQPKTTLLERKVAGGVGARWIPVSIDLTPYAGRVVGLELRAVRATQGGRIAFGEPRLSRPHVTAAERPKAKSIVIVLASSLDRHLIPPWGPVGDNSAIGELLRDGVAFHGYRVPTTLPSGVFASLLTGVAPARHHVEDTAARLNGSMHPLSEIIKQAGGRTAMFTGVPTTFAAFGFNVGWDDYVSQSPVADLPAETPLVDAARWLGQRLDQNRDALRFVVVHARGTHPPWDLTKEQTAQLLPADYGGVIDARRGGVTLGKIRRQTAKVQRRLNDEDTQRLAAFMKAAWAKQNSALESIISTLKRKEAWDDTLFIFAGDTANPELPAIPFDPVGQLREDQLTVPLIVKFPGRLHAGQSFDRPVTTVDLTRTILDAIDLMLPEPVEGESLLDAVSDREPLLTRTLVATLGQRYVSRTGVWLLSGELGTRPKLCQTDIDPMCVDDQFGKMPLVARALWKWTAQELGRARRAGKKAPREPASIDPETAAALTVWGDVEM
jgi:hypothetical protein